MKKRLLAMLLAASMLLGGSSTAVTAAEYHTSLKSNLQAQAKNSEDAPMSVEEGIEPISWDLVSDENSIRVVEPDKPLQLAGISSDYYPDSPYNTPDHEYNGSLMGTLDQYAAVTEDTVFEITNKGSDKDDQMYLFVYLQEYVEGASGTGYLMDYSQEPARKMPLDGIFIHGRTDIPLYDAADYSDGYGDETSNYPETLQNQEWRSYGDILPWDTFKALIRLYPGESTQVTLPKSKYNSIYEMRVCAYYPKYDYTYWRYDYYKVVDKLPPLETVGGFTDVKKSDYFADAVLWAVENGVTNGTSATTFSPEKGCTRAQAVTFLWNAAGKPEPAKNTTTFTDVPAGSYYEKAVQWAVESGITNGISETVFGSSRKCTRAQIVTFLYRANGSPLVTGDESFSDVTDGAYFEDAVIWAVQYGITSGMGENTFAPDTTCIRAQIVTFLYRDSRLP